MPPPTSPPPTSHRAIQNGLLIAGLLTVAALAGAAWWWRGPILSGESGQPASSPSPPTPPPPSKPEPPAEDYVGSRACRICHSEIAEQYDGHMMAHSLAPTREARPLEDYEQAVRFQQGGCDYWVERADDGVYHHESFSDSDGTLFDERVEVQLAVGSGHRGRSYFIERGGLMFMSPISWYSQKGRWDLSPNYPERNHPRFERPVTGRCLGCHAGRVNHERGENDRFAHPAIREHQISCERCHGPGREHVAWHRAGTDRAGADPIVNPARLSPSRRESVCNACHLQGIDEVRRYGRTDFDFRPGMDIGEVWSIFVEGTGVSSSGETTAVSQVQQMQASRCFQESDGKLGCIACHNPHRLPTPETRLTEYNSRCNSCHSSRGCSLSSEERERPPAAGSCIDCHMPRLGASDVPHTTQTDHRVLRRPQAQSAMKREAGPDEESLRIFDLDVVPLDEFARNRALGIVEATRAEHTQDAQRAARAVELLAPVWAADPRDGATADAYGIALALSGKPTEAIEVWGRALPANPHHEALLFSLGLAHLSAGQPAEAQQYVDRLVQVNPWKFDYQMQRARVQLANRRVKEALETGLIAAGLNPVNQQIHDWLARVYEQSGSRADAERHRRILRRLERR